MGSVAIISTDSLGLRLLVPQDFKKNHFNTLRLAMALLVIWSHSFALYYGSEDGEPLSLLMNGVFNAGNLGVRVFFIISGFLITVSYLRSPSLIDYLKKRIARIYPGYIVAVAVCAFIVVPLFSTRVDMSPSAIALTLGSALQLQGIWPASDVFVGHPGGAEVNGALWSIPLEFWCYLGVAALGLMRLLSQRWLLLAGMIGIMLVKTALEISGVKLGGIVGALILWYYPWFTLAPCFMAGMLAYLFRDAIPRSRLLALILLGALILSAQLSAPLCNLLFTPVVAYLTFYLAMSDRPVPDAAYYGDFSYGTYLYGFPVQQMLIGLNLPFAVYMPTAMIASLAAGIASWFLVERRFLSRKRIKEFTGHAVPAIAAAARSA